MTNRHKDTLDLIDAIWKPCPHRGENNRNICEFHLVRHRAVPEKVIMDQIMYILDLHHVPSLVLSNHWGISRQALAWWFERYYGQNRGLVGKTITKSEWQYILEQAYELVTNNTDIKTIAELSRIIEQKNFVRAKNVGQRFKTFIQRKDIKNLDIVLDIHKIVKENKKRPPNFIKCYRCSATKPFTEFYNSKATIDGYSRTCKECSKAQQTKYYYKRKEANKDGNVFVDEKYCTYCKQTKPASDYDRQSASNTGLQQYCKVCQSMLGKRSNLRKRMSKTNVSYKFKESLLEIERQTKDLYEHSEGIESEILRAELNILKTVFDLMKKEEEE